MDWMTWILLYVGIVTMVLVFFAGASNEEREAEAMRTPAQESGDLALARSSEPKRQLELALDGHDAK